MVPANVSVTKVQGTGTGKYYLVDANSRKRYVVLNSAGKYVYEVTNTVVDINAPVSTTIIDLDTSAALANANGQLGEGKGIVFGLNLDENGNLKGTVQDSAASANSVANDNNTAVEPHYTSSVLTVTSSGNVIVGSAIGVAVKAGGSSSSVGVAAATSVNDVTNSFNASVTGSTV